MDSVLQLEYYAIYCLAHFYREFEDWVKSESPDFCAKSGDWGLEVTRALDEQEEQFRNYIISVYSVGKHVRKRIKPYSRKGVYDPSAGAKVAWVKKCMRLCRPHFQTFPSNRLVILASLDHFSAEDIEKFFRFLEDERLKAAYRRCFDIVYVISFENVLKYDIQRGIYDVKGLSRELHCSFMVEAAKRVSQQV